MHMADALLSPAVGGTMWAVSAGTIAYCSSKVRADLDDSKVPLMGVLGAFIFAAQMINFSIPGTGSSGHLGGGLLLSILLGPEAAFITIASVLFVQALFFADGGLLSLGCNIFNLGFFPAFVAYPFFYRKIANGASGRGRMTFAAILAAVAGLQMGAFGVVLETVSSGISALPFSTFVILMLPIHLAIGVVEGVVTAAVVSFVAQARPEILQGSFKVPSTPAWKIRNVVIAFSFAALVCGGFLSWFASKKPDGLEWAIARVTGKGELNGPSQGVHRLLSSWQESIAFLPDYSFRKPAEAKSEATTPGGKKKIDVGNNLETSISGIVGGIITLAIVFVSGLLLRRRKQAG